MNTAPNELLRDASVLVLDCDGVILDSNEAKIEAFSHTATELGIAADVVDRFSTWQKGNFGTPRTVMFRKLVDGEFGPVSASVRIEDLLDAYGAQCMALYERVPETDGLRAFLDATDSIPRYVVSGSDQSELRTVLRRRGLAHRFRGILGSPSGKSANMESITAEWTRATGEPPTLGVVIGDAMADLTAAEAVGFSFIFLARYSMVRDELQQHCDERGIASAPTLESLTSPIGRTSQ